MDCGTRLILAVDHEPAGLRLIEVNLKRQGYRIVTAASTQEAIERISEEPPDLIIAEWPPWDMTDIECLM